MLFLFYVGHFLMVRVDDVQHLEILEWKVLDLE